METKFNFNSAICTNLEQSRRLLALGLKKETADMPIMMYSGCFYRQIEFVKTQKLWVDGKQIEVITLQPTPYAIKVN